MNNDNPGVHSIRASGTPMPGTKQGKKATKTQTEKRSKNDEILHRLNQLEQVVMQVTQALQKQEQQARVGALERHVALSILDQQVGREPIEALMASRAEHFGLQIKFDETKVDDEQNEVDEPDTGDLGIPTKDEYGGTEEYTE